MKEETTYPEEHSLQGVTESFSGSLDGLARARCNRYTVNHGSFLLKDGRYVYRDYVWMDEPKRELYHILSIEDKEILRFLDYWDKHEEKQNRSGGAVGDRESYAYQNHLQRDDEDEESSTADPIDRYAYTEWFRDEYAINNEDASNDERAYKIFGLMLDENNKSGLKAIAAQCLASMLRWKYVEKPENLTQDNMFDLDLYQYRILETERVKLQESLENDPYVSYLVKAIRYAVGVQE